MGLKPVESTRKIQLVLASGSRFFLEGVANILKSEANVKILARASNGTEIINYINALKPDFLFLDNRTLKLNFHNLSNLIDIESPNTKVILFGYQDKNDKPSKIIYLAKETDASKLMEILKTPNGCNPNEKAADEENQKNKLTRTELKIINLVKSGFSNKVIAQELSIGEETVKTNLRKIFMKLKLQNRYQLIVYARKLKHNSY